MSNYICNGKIYDVWNVEFQERLVDYYGHDNQVMKAQCESIKPTAQEAYGDLSEWLITK